MRHLIIDGYNVVRSTDRYSSLAATDLDAARAKLVSDALTLLDRSTRVTVVFDAGRASGSAGAAHHVGRVAVVFTKPGVSADEVIESLAHRARAKGETAVVVTSDAATQMAVIGGSVIRMSAREFADAIAAEETERSADFAPRGTRVPVERRIDTEVRRALERWSGRSRGRR